MRKKYFGMRNTITVLMASFMLIAFNGMSQIYTFTNAGQTGRFGPSQSQLNSAYAGTTLAGAVTSSNGIQIWTVPSSGNYKITVIGAQGHGTFGGRGAQLEGEFNLTGGQQLKILVGQEGSCCAGAGTNQYGGGGGSFVTDMSNNALIIAGGGGGSWASGFTSTTDASVSTSGNSGANGSPNATGGSNGQGGGTASSADGGGGLNGNGQGTAGGASFVNGGNGGTAGNGGTGGFGGGGGGSSWNNRRAGGGGGYSGGGGSHGSTSLNCEGGGGGSFNSGLNPVSIVGVGTGHGMVIIENLAPVAYDASCTDLEIVGNIYSQIPLAQASGLQFESTALSSGDSTIDGVQLNLSIQPSGHTDLFVIDTLQSQQDSTITYPMPFIPTMSGNYTASSVVSMNQTDTIPLNDTSTTMFTISDTVLAMDDSIAVGGLGFNPPYYGIFGNVYELNTVDTLTSVTAYLNAPTLGVSFRYLIYDLDTNGFPDQILDSTRTLEVTSSTGSWYSLRVGCEGLILQPGKYFVGIEQLNPLNLSAGYFNSTADTGISFFKNTALNDPWTDNVTNTGLERAKLMVRMNFGGAANALDVLPDSTRYCNNSSIYIKPNGSFKSYLWSNSTTGDSTSVSSQGVYSLTVTDDISCQYIDSVEVVENPTYNVNVMSNMRATCGNADGMVAVSANSVFGPISYSWDNQMMGDTIRNIAGGSYEVTAMDAYGCKEMQVVKVLGIYPSTSTAFEYPTCNGDADGRATVIPSDTIGTVNYAWSAGNNQTSATTGGLVAGTYYITLTDDNNCPVTDSIVVMDPAVMSLDTMGSSNPTGCNSADGVATVNPAGGIAPYTYSWAGDPNATTKNFIGRKAGRYDVTVTDKNGCVKTTSVTLIEENAPMITITEDSVTCHYDEGTSRLSVSGGTAPYGFTWSNSNGVDSNITATPGTYSVNISDAAGCNQLRTVKVKGPEAIDITFNVIDNGECNMEAQAVIIGGNSPYSSVTWSNGQSGNTATGLCNKDSLTYWVFVEDAEGCIDSAEVAVKSRYTSVSSLAGLNSGFVMYPNPTQGNVTLTFDALKSSDDLSIRVFDMLGSTVSTLSGTGAVLSNNVSLDLSDQPSGVYMVEVSLNGTTTTKRLQVGK